MFLFIKMFRLKRLSTKMLKICRRPCSSCKSEPASWPTQMSVLQNGVRIATEESNSPLACVALFAEVGSVNEQPLEHGMTHVVEHMAYRGFKSMDKQKLEDCLCEMGAKMSVLTTREFQVFYGQCLVDNVGNMVKLLSKIITDLELSGPELEIAKSIIDMESQDADNNPKAVVSDYLHETAFQGTPLGRRIIGPSSYVNKINRYDVEAYITKNYFPSRLILVTSGAVSHGQMVSAAESSLGSLSQSCDDKFVSPQRFTGSSIVYRDDSMNFVHLAMAVEAPGLNNSDYVTMLLASNIIGSYNKSQGGNLRHGIPLAKAAATSSLCEHVESFYIPYRHVGLWGIYTVAAKMDIEDILHNVQDQWMNLCMTTSESDMQRGLNAAKFEVAKKIEGSVKSCLDLGTQIIYKKNRTNLPQLYKDLASVSKKTIRNVAYRYLYDKCLAVSAVGPTEALPDYTRLRSGMYWLRF